MIFCFNAKFSNGSTSSGLAQSFRSVALAYVLGFQRQRAFITILVNYVRSNRLPVSTYFPRPRGTDQSLSKIHTTATSDTVAYNRTQD